MKQKLKSVKSMHLYPLLIVFLLSGCTIGTSVADFTEVKYGPATHQEMEQSSITEKEETDKAILRTATNRKAKEAEAARNALIKQEQDRVAKEAERAAQEQAQAAQAAKETERIAQEKKNAATVAVNDPYQWIQDAQRRYGVYADPDTTFLVSDVGNCGGPRGGCTNQWSTFTGPITTHISPSGIGDYQLLFHEIAHTRGIIDECAADRWAHNVTGVVVWKYAGCAR